MVRRLPLLLTSVAFGVVALAAPAWAHVSADPRELPAGGFSVITFRVPTESDTASTTKLEIELPPDAPFQFVSVKPTPGWTHREQKAKLPRPVETEDGEISDYTSVITWEGGKIAPGEFQEFDVSVGPIPDVGKLVFKAVQTYDNGDVVSWIDEPTGKEEPEHPAPTITVAKSSVDEEAAAATPEDEEDDDGTDPLAVVGVVLGALALVVAAGAFAASRRRRS